MIEAAGQIRQVDCECKYVNETVNEEIGTKGKIHSGNEYIPYIYSLTLIWRGMVDWI